MKYAIIQSINQSINIIDVTYMYFQMAEPDTKQINKGVHVISWQYLPCLQDNKQTMFTLLFFFFLYQLVLLPTWMAEL